MKKQKNAFPESSLCFRKIQESSLDQKQLNRLNETKSNSGGGFEICQAVSFALFLALLAPQINPIS